MSKWYPCIYCTEDLHCTKYSDDDCESWCVLGPCTAETPSNGDKIRRMTDEELAEWVDRIRMYCANDLCGRGCPLEEICYSKADAPTETLDWLKQEAANDNHDH